jgi:hypothetical protein
MARPHRIELPNPLYHITSRGNRREYFGIHYMTVSRAVRQYENNKID